MNMIVKIDADGIFLSRTAEIKESQKISVPIVFLGV